MNAEETWLGDVAAPRSQICVAQGIEHTAASGQEEGDADGRARFPRSDAGEDKNPGAD